MAAVMQRNGDHYYGNGHVTYSDSDAEMAVDCPPAYVAAHPPYPGIQTRNIETPPPTPYDNNLIADKQNKRTTKDLEDVAAVAATLPQPEMDFSRINRMRESAKRKKELRKRDQQVREEMSRDEGAEKIRRIKTLTSEEDLPNRRGIDNTGFESDTAYDTTQDADTTLVAYHPPQTVELRDIFASLDSITPQIRNPELLTELQHLQKMVKDNDFQEAAKLQQSVANSISTSLHDNAAPVHRSAATLVSEVCEELAYRKSPASRDLAATLSKPFMMSLMRTHDDVAKETGMSLSSSNNEDANIVQRASMYNVRKPIRIVRINKHNDPLGATVRIDENDGRVLISRIVTGGAADKSRLLNENDEIVEVNGEPMKGKDVNTVGDMIAGMNGLLTFVIVPADDREISNGHVNNGYDNNREPVMHVRALFDYDAYDDPYLPCRELGLSFQKGDILHIMTQDDKNWWQAYREGEEDKLTLPGLIPSLDFHMQIENVRISLEKKEPEPENEKGMFCGRKKKKNKKKKKVQTPVEEDPIEVYEEMALYHQPEEKKRPIVLIGPPNVGRHELRQKLVENDKNRFSFAVPHTTRAMETEEVEGEEYHFISMKLFEQMMADNKFIEHGSYLKNLYGTTFQSVEHVIESGKICVLNLHAPSLKLIKASDLKPYIIFIAPPPLERLRQNMAKEGKQIKEDELRNIIESARDIEHNYAHYFDETIRNIDLSRSYAELLRLINKLDTEPQWVPASWVD